jgi:signal peptidase I
MLNRIIEQFKYKLYTALTYLTVVFFIYLIIANAVFAFRHPWSTDMERFIHIGDALMFNKISYKEMRGEYEER